MSLSDGDVSAPDAISLTEHNFIVKYLFALADSMHIIYRDNIQHDCRR